MTRLKNGYNTLHCNTWIDTELTPNNTDWVLPVPSRFSWTVVENSRTVAAVLRWPFDTCPVCWFWRSDDGSSRERPLYIFVSPCSRKLDIETLVFADTRTSSVSIVTVSLCNCVRIENTDTPGYLRIEFALVGPPCSSGRSGWNNTKIGTKPVYWATFQKCNGS